MSEKDDIQPKKEIRKPCIYIKYRAFSPLKENKKYFKTLSVYSISQMNEQAKNVSPEELSKNIMSNIFLSHIQNLYLV